MGKKDRGVGKKTVAREKTQGRGKNDGGAGKMTEAWEKTQELLLGRGV